MTSCTEVGSLGAGWSRSRISNSNVYTRQAENRSVLGTGCRECGSVADSSDHALLRAELSPLSSCKLSTGGNACSVLPYPLIFKKQILEIQLMWISHFKKYGGQAKLLRPLYPVGCQCMTSGWIQSLFQVLGKASDHCDSSAVTFPKCLICEMWRVCSMDTIRFSSWCQKWNMVKINSNI